ncbi:uncharacterized protein L969DRAFT_88396 [Mixia osmundae IAM 14324]|uniref:MICOS complex subunit MIC19 n=1 Tax=Mixia osmundae (strain CBS 9802 / IAM 14324 / JCM 22182 / KY 12970) TaxID=764103 RepID=G7E701_MIXOS|nr:uncharacterized protein L969DRAFT_88396 [Mixia osmundae IAM 14324]KEI39006.1 hypothetical protein L969DRAFT_88396 [Mixia osmundae IAM 14324]GAA98611.1 hypothetical protein E5Q_05298 [Mixia osmundae IAM 14324]
MGASGSKAEVVEEGKEKQFYSNADTPIRFSPGLINHLQDSASPSSERQQTLDSHIQERIKSELTRLQSEESEIRAQIAQALEKENLDKSRGSAEKGEGKSSLLLERDLEVLRAKVERRRQRTDELAGPDSLVGKTRTALVQCYRNNPKTTLDCDRETDAFKAAVKQLEQQFVASVH